MIDPALQNTEHERKEIQYREDHYVPEENAGTSSVSATIVHVYMYVKPGPGEARGRYAECPIVSYIRMNKEREQPRRYYYFFRSA